MIGVLYALALVATLLLGDKLPGGTDSVTKTLVGSMLWVTWPLVGVTALVYAGAGRFFTTCIDTGSSRLPGASARPATRSGTSSSLPRRA